MPKLLKSFFCFFFWLWERKYNILPLSTDFWTSCKIKWFTLHNIMKMSLFYHLTHQEVQRHLYLFQPHPTMSQLFLEFFSFSCVSFLDTLDADRHQKFWLLSTTWKCIYFFFYLSLPDFKDKTADVFTTLFFFFSSGFLSSSPTTSMMSVGLLLALRFFPCNWHLDRKTSWENIQGRIISSISPMFTSTSFCRAGQ